MKSRYTHKKGAASIPKQMTQKISLVLVFILALQSAPMALFAEPVFASSNMALQKAVKLALLSSDSVEEIELDLVKKGMERQQAEEGLRDIRKKESTVRFSLLFNIEFPETHGLPKEIELIMKLPKIDHEIDVLNHKLDYTKEKITFEVKNIYLDLILAERTGIALEKQLKSQKATVNRLSDDLKKGDATQDDLDASKEELKNLETLVAKSEKKYFALKEKLTLKCGSDMMRINHFDTDLYMALINRNDIEPFVQMGEQRDFDFYTVVQERKLAEKATDELVDIYRGRYGSKVNRIMPEVQKQKANKAKFLKAYNAMLDDIDRPWTRVFKINLLFFTIRIPFRWFQGEYTALRYFEDQKYALFVAVLDRDKKRVTEAAAQKQLEEKIKTAYDAVKEMELAYRQSVDFILEEKDNYQTAFEQNKLGKLSFSELEAARLALMNAEQMTINTLIEYNKMINMLNFYTVGGLNGKLLAVDVDSGNYISGDSIPVEEEGAGGALKKEPDKPTWNIIVPYTAYRFSFGIKLPSSIEATHYQLKLEDGRKIGDKTEVKKRLEHMPIVFSDSSVLILDLYKDKELIYEATFEGTDYAGTLELKAVNQTERIEALIGKSYGSYKIIANSKTGLSSLFIKLTAAMGATGYALMPADQNTKEETLKPEIVKIDEPIQTLSFVLSDLKAYRLVFYKDAEAIFTAKLIAGAGGLEGVLVIIEGGKEADQ